MRDIQEIVGSGWEILRQIGSGSFGTVYEIQRDNAGTLEKAALKVISIPKSRQEIEELYGDGFSEEGITARFHRQRDDIIREYSLMKRIKGHTNLVYCDDLIYEPHDDGIGWDIYIKMELLTPMLRGLPDAITEEQVIKLGKDICSALVVCHRQDIIHRDVKPQNILISDSGDFKLGDFGIAKTSESMGYTLRLGTAKFMAPEAYRGVPYGHSADVYSLGLIMYWMLNQRRLPFLPLPPNEYTAAMENEAIGRRCGGDPIPDPVGGSPRLKQIVRKACAHDPADRYGDAAQMLEDLERLSGEEPVAEQKSAGGPVEKLREFFRNSPRKARTVAAAAALTLVLAGVLCFCGLNREELVIHTQPTAQVVNEGEPVLLQVEATGDGLAYQWMIAWPETAEFVEAGCTEAVCSVVLNETTDGSRLYCVITDKHGQSVQTETVTITMIPALKLLVQPEDITVPEGEQAVVRVEAAGRDLTFEWYYKEKGGKEFQKTDAFRSGEYYVEMTEERDGRQVYCVITDGQGDSVQTDTVTMTMIPKLKILTQPKDAEALEGKTVTVTVEVRGQELRYEWYFREKNGKEFQRTDSFRSGEYYIEMTEERDGRQVYCVITDGQGDSVQTDTVTMTMIPELKILTQPKDAEALEGKTVTVTVEAQGRDLAYEWYFREKNGKEFTKTDSFTGNTYTVEMSRERDHRQVYCVITDSFGNRVQSETVTLTMKEPIVIVSQPKNAKAAEGEQAVVTVKAEGEKLTYEWYYKDRDSKTFKKTDSFTGSTYAVEMNEARDRRQVYCVITDARGNSVQTDTVTLKLK